jgi:transcriptional regulator with XRE-family HTH domain
METANKRKRHIGKNISRIRGLRGIKQESLAMDLGLSQSEVSIIENSDSIEEELLSQIANILNVTPEIIEKFDENLAVFNINNSIENTTITESSQGIHQIFNPLDQVVELYERLLASEKEKLELLKKNE